MEADAARPGMVSRAPVMGRDTPEPPVTHVRTCVWVYFFKIIIYCCVCIYACGLLLVIYSDLMSCFPRNEGFFFFLSTSACDINALPQKWWRTRKSFVLCVMRVNMEKGKRNTILFN